MKTITPDAPAIPIKPVPGHIDLSPEIFNRLEKYLFWSIVSVILAATFLPIIAASWE
jgi:hypothetical protein